MPYIPGDYVTINIRKDPETDEWLVTQRKGARVLSERTYFGDEEEDAVYTAINEFERAREAGEIPDLTDSAHRRIQKYEPGFLSTDPPIRESF